MTEFVEIPGWEEYLPVREDRIGPNWRPRFILLPTTHETDDRFAGMSDASTGGTSGCSPHTPTLRSVTPVGIPEALGGSTGCAPNVHRMSTETDPEMDLVRSFGLNRRIACGSSRTPQSALPEHSSPDRMG